MVVVCDGFGTAGQVICADEVDNVDNLVNDELDKPAVVSDKLGATNNGKGKRPHKKIYLGLCSKIILL